MRDSNTNNNNKSSVSSGGLTFTSVLGIVFIVLKLMGVINWSWVWVLSPFWIGLLLGLILLAIMGLFAYFYVKSDDYKNKKG